MPDDVPEVQSPDELFDVPVGVFVAARDDLVRRLRADGRTDEARRVTALRRPTLSAWAVNRVVRTDRDAWQELVAAGEQVQRAQRRALSGVRDSGLREAAASRRELVESLTGRARALLVEAGARPDTHLDDVAATFEAASADPEVAGRVGAAQLSAPVLVTSDFSGTALLAVSAEQAAGDGSAPDEDDVDPAVARRRREAIRALEAARARAEVSAAAARDARAAAKSLDERASEARREARVAREAAERAEQEADDLVARARRAEADANAAVVTAERDGEAVDEARAVLDGLA